eukprot:CAMPEP_0204274932 /NCGR_PEP_ID=MMETSP0468-20130131/25461_1 /ASSEMBLY_ACC=CAM_ASM_000383 /TAXON_ID=2969 /ORGANISM="Oxyrrhis marina" /LENGTH=827 /DNA_ID=CAMNT_0051251203 /DNA_START=39 /DNA_END=2522 /DNA_ORIENTATION=-
MSSPPRSPTPRLSESEGEDLFADNMADDYQPVPELDTLEGEPGITREEAAELTADQRAAAEAEMNERDRGVKRRHEETQDDEDGGQGRRRMSRRIEQEDDAFDDEDGLDSLTDFKITPGQPLPDQVARAIKRSFEKFLLEFCRRGETEAAYHDVIARMAEKYSQSLPVRVEDLVEHNTRLVLQLAEFPSVLLPLLHEAALGVVHGQYPTYDSKSEVFVRLVDFPVEDKIRSLRGVNVNTIVHIVGVVTKRTLVLPELRELYVDCAKCGYRLGPFFITDSNDDIRPGDCPECGSRGPFKANREDSLYRNYQKITLQEAPGSVPPGRTPRAKEVILTADLVDKVKPGDLVQVVGTYRIIYSTLTAVRNRFPVFDTVIEANNVVNRATTSLQRITDSDFDRLNEMANSRGIRAKIIRSIAPSIYGNEHAKTALCMAMFGGVAKQGDQGHRLRGDINVLLLGDPGCAKSQMLKYVEKSFHRVVYTTGKGASGVGLTASMKRDYATGEWTLEGGAMVLADSGLCLIDEFDKMNEQDRTSIHEAMEQQTISISKAGLVTTLHARCAVVAAANPILGRYDPQKTFMQNVDLTDPILSRFDVLCVLRDEVNSVNDERMADFIMASHMASHPTNPVTVKRLFASREAEDVMDQEDLQKYLLYARTLNPVASDAHTAVVNEFYAEIRRVAHASGGINIGVRHLESILRLAQANARMELREQVIQQDVNNAIATCLESFIQTQKYQVAEELRKRFARFLVRADDDYELLHWLLMREYRAAVSMAMDMDQDPDGASVNRADFARIAGEYEMATDEYLASSLFKEVFFLSGEKIKKIIVE